MSVYYLYLCIRSLKNGNSICHIKSSPGPEYFHAWFYQGIQRDKNFQGCIGEGVCGKFSAGEEGKLIWNHTAVLETIIRFLLLVGLFTQPAIIGGSLLMLFLIFGKSIKSDWQTVSFQNDLYNILRSTGRLRQL